MTKTFFRLITKIVFLFFLILFSWVNHSAAQSTGDYRTKKSGLWTDSSVWETYKDSVWINATHYPTYQNKTISILNDTVTIKNISLNIDQLVIDSGLLYLKQNASVHLKNGTGNDLINNGTISIYNSTVDLRSGAVLLNDINGTIIFQTSDTITGSGKINNKNVLKTYTNILIPDGIVFNQTSGTIQGTGDISIADTINESAADIKVPLTILKGAVLNINTSVAKKMSDITNNGTVNWNAGDISFYSGTTFTNNTQLNINEQGSLLNAEKTVAKLINAKEGKIEKFDNSSTTIKLDINNLGSIIVHQGVLITSGTFHDSYVFNLAKNTTFENEGEFYADSSEKLTGSGLFENLKTVTVSYIDTLPKNIRFNNDDNLEGTGQLYVQGNIYLHGICKIPVTIASTGKCNTLGINVSAPFTNNGFVQLWDGDYKIGAEFINNGELEIDNAYCTFTQGNDKAKFINNGRMIGKYGYPSTFTINCTFINAQQGSLEGIAAFDFKDTLVNEGSIDPGLTTPGSQIDFFYSPFQNTSTTNIRIGDNGKGKTKADNIFVYNGNTTLDGTLNLYQTSEAIDTGYYTIVGNYGQIDDTTIIGRFSHINKPDNWDIVYTNISVIVHVKAPAGLLQPVALNKNILKVLNDSRLDKKSLIFPNPAMSIAKIYFDAEGKYTINIINASGKLLQTKTGIATKGINTIQFDVSKYISGVYLIEINDESNNKQLLKLIKQ